MPEDTKSLRQRITELEELHRLAQSLSSILNVYEMLETIADCCVKLCKAERAAIVLLSPVSGESAHTMVRTPAHDEGGIDHLINGLAVGWILDHGKPLFTSDVLQELEIKNPPDRLKKLGAALAVPLMAQGQMIGMINLVNSRGESKFTEDTLRIALLLAPLAAQFIDKAKVYESLQEDRARLRALLGRHQDLQSIIGQSPATKDILDKISKVASSTATVMLFGETGTGKELVAKAIHFQSPRAEKPFIAVNCAAIPSTLVESELFGHERGAFTGATDTMRGKFEVANGGTIFLDEMPAMPLELQPKLLRVLEERSFSRIGSSSIVKVDVRVIAATNRDLEEAVRKGEFREDLYHRLNVLPIYLPPLRERSEDIPLLAQTFLDEFSGGTKRFSAEALEVLNKLTWRGNIRELRNIVERISIFVSAGEIADADLRSIGIGSDFSSPSHMISFLREYLRARSGNVDLIEELEKNLVQVALEESGGNVSKASHLLGIDRNALQRRVEKYQIDR